MKRCFFLTALLITSACVRSPQQRDLKEAQGQQAQGRLKEALVTYEKTFKKFPDTSEALIAARAGARLALVDIKDYAKAVEFLKHLVLYSDSEKERNDAQKDLADIYYERLNNYRLAAVEYNRLLQVKLPVNEVQRIRLNLAKSHFYLSQFVQAQSEIGLLLESKPPEETFFAASLLRGNVYLAEKKLDDAIKILGDLMAKFPDRAKEEQLGLTLAVCHEEKRDYRQARAVLASIRDNYPKPEFIDLKIRRLAEREKHLPGAGGLKK